MLTIFLNGVHVHVHSDPHFLAGVKLTPQLNVCFFSVVYTLCQMVGFSASRKHCRRKTKLVQINDQKPTLPEMHQGVGK